MDSGDALLVIGAAALVVWVVRQQRQPRFVYVSAPFQPGAEIECPQTTLPMCPGGIPKCYDDGTVSCGGFSHAIPDILSRMQAWCVENPAACKAVPK